MTYTPFGFEDAPAGYRPGQPAPANSEEAALTAARMEAFGQYVHDGALADATALVTPVANVANVLQADTNSTYLGIYFGGDEAPKGQQLFLASSPDATTFTPHGSPISTGASQSRDQDIINYAGRYWLAYTKTPAFNTVSTAFGLSVSDDLVTWTTLADVDCSSVSNIKRAWGPCWSLEDGTPRVFIAISVTNSDQGPFVMYETHPTNDTMTAWSAPVNISSGLPSSVFDFTVRKVGSTWIALYKDNVTEFICRATSSNYTGPWTVTNTGDWMGHAAALGTSPPAAEGTHIAVLPNGKTRLWFDRYRIPPAGDYRAARTYYSDTSDAMLASGWSAPTISNTLGRHARVRQMRLPASFRGSTTSSHIELARLATYAAPNTSFTPIPWDYVDEDPDGMFDSSLDATSVAIRNGGLWTVTFNGVFLTAATGNVFAGIMFNEDYGPGVTEKRSAAGFDPAVVLSVTRRLRRGDRVAACVQSDAARNLGTVPPPRLRVTRIGD